MLVRACFKLTLHRSQVRHLQGRHGDAHQGAGGGAGPAGHSRQRGACSAAGSACSNVSWRTRARSAHCLPCTCALMHADSAPQVLPAATNTPMLRAGFAGNEAGAFVAAAAPVNSCFVPARLLLHAACSRMPPPTPQGFDALSKFHPVGRICEPEEIAQARLPASAAALPFACSLLLHHALTRAYDAACCPFSAQRCAVCRVPGRLQQVRLHQRLRAAD